MFPRAVAVRVASEFLGELAPVCRKIEVAGSIRREKAEVNNIDFVAIPIVVRIQDLSGKSGPLEENLLESKLAHLYARGWFTVHSNGPRVKRLIRVIDGQAIPTTIRVADEESWWTTLLVMTGSHGHNISMSCRAFDRGMRLRGDGSGLYEADGTRITVRSEEEIFTVLGLDYRPPKARV
jgi:DNA polymerase/3'-5' exonuclease PolX